MNRREKIKKTVIALTVITGIVASLAALNFIMTAPAQQDTASNATSRKLIFSDEFSSSSIDTSKWNFCYDNYSEKYQGCTNYGNWEDQWYTKSQVSQSGGNLTLTALRQKTSGSTKDGYPTNYKYTSGMISSGAKDVNSLPKWEGQYGYYEARMLVPSGQAVWPAFWLLPTDRSWPPEIDIMEMLGDKTNELLTTYHWKTSDGQAAKDSSQFITTKPLSNDWHVYGMEWQKGRIEWFLDGKSVKIATGNTIPSKNMQIIMNLAVGGTLPGRASSQTPDTAVMLIDYVRVYDRK